MKRRNILIVLTTTTMFFVSNFPYVLWCLDFYNIIDIFEGKTLVLYTRFTFIVMQTSCFINPFIYYLTNKSFRGYCKKTISRSWKDRRDNGTDNRTVSGRERVERQPSKPVNLTQQSYHSNSYFHNFSKLVQDLK